MHPAAIPAKKKTVLASALALGVGLALPAQAYLLDFTVASLNPGACISNAGGYPSGPPLVGSNLKVIDVSLTGDLTRKLSPAITLHNRIRKNDGLIAYFGIPRQTANDNFTLGVAASFASAPGVFTSTIVPSGNILNHLAPFSSTLLLLGSGLMGLGLIRRRKFFKGLKASHPSG